MAAAMAALAMAQSAMAAQMAALQMQMRQNDYEAQQTMRRHRAAQSSAREFGGFDIDRNNHFDIDRR
jgi:hypothetical protein